jgi:hypothetical protein
VIYNPGTHKALGDIMENWKRAAVAGSACGALILLVKHRRPAAVLVGGVGLALLASEYPDTFEKIREELPSYVRQGTRFMDLAMKIGNKIGSLSNSDPMPTLEELGDY